MTKNTKNGLREIRDKKNLTPNPVLQLPPKSLWHEFLPTRPYVLSFSYPRKYQRHQLHHHPFSSLLHPTHTHPKYAHHTYAQRPLHLRHTSSAQPPTRPRTPFLRARVSPPVHPSRASCALSSSANTSTPHTGHRFPPHDHASMHAPQNAWRHSRCTMRRQGRTSDQGCRQIGHGLSVASGPRSRRM